MRSRFDLSRMSTEDSDNEEIVYRGHPSKKALGVSTQWQYRRSDRSHTDDAKNMQPRTAPSGVDAQKAENFRKFYRAVVSPTHVRVTAGGRIVPNSRAPAQPVFVWNKDRVAFGTVASSADAAAQLNGGTQVGQKKLQSTDSSFGISGQTSTRSSYQKSDSSATAQSLEPKDAAAQSSIAGVAPQLQHASQGLKISPPENFDPNRPFYLNGCLVSPLPRDIKLPPGLHPVPLSMIGNTGQQQLQYQQQPQVMGAFQSSAPAFLAPQNQNQRLMPGMAGPTAYSYRASSQLPVVLPTSEMSGSRLNHHKSTPALNSNVYRMDRFSPKALNAKRKSFQDEIERIDHQLKYNTHQTDEKHENQKRQHILEQIYGIDMQLHAMGFAPMAQPRSSVQDRRSAAVPVTALDLTKPMDKGDSFAEPSSFYDGLSTGFKTQVPWRETASESIPRPTASMVSSLGWAATLDNPAPLPSTDTKPTLIAKKRLSPSSARAPEFKPRSLFTVESANTPAVVANNSTLFTTPVKGVMDAKKAAQVSVPIPYPEYGAYENKHATMEVSNSRLLAYSEELPPASAAYQNTAAYQHVPVSAQNSSIGKVGPYLSGYIQPGLNESGVQQFNYSRPLTESELLARKLYWGSGGKQHQQKGLPKFDGKDFYPPSPTKPSTASASQSRASEASTVLRKYNSSALTSKASEESGVLQKLDEEDAPVTPRRNQVNHKASAPGLELKSTDENKENCEIIKSTEDLDAWCAKNDIHMPDGSTPITRTKTAALLAKLANISPPKFRFTRDSKPASVAASVAASERSESYTLPKLLARGASKAVAAASEEFAPARPSAQSQISAMSGIAKLQTTTPAVIEALQVPPSQPELRRPPSKSIRTVSESFATAAIFDPPMGTFAGSALAATELAMKAQDQEASARSQPLIRSTTAREYLQMVARTDARRAQETQASEQQKKGVTLEREAAESALAGQRARTIPQPGAEAKTAAESLAVHQQAYVAKNLPLHPRSVDGIGYIPPASQLVQAAKLPLKYAVPPTLVAPSAINGKAPPVQMLQQKMPYPPPMQFQYAGPPMPYHMGPGHPAFQVPMAPGQQYPVPMQPGQPYPGQGQGQGQGQWVWHDTQGPPAPQQGPPPAR